MNLPLFHPKRVLVVEDHLAIRQDAEMLINRQPEFLVVGSCGNVQDALVLIPATKPDLLLLDINLEDGSGFDLLEQISPFTFQVIFLTAHEQYAIRAIKLGAIDYLLKPLDETELRQALDKMLHSHIASQRHPIIAHQYWDQSMPAGRLVLNSQQYSLIVELQEIIYCHSHAGYTTFHLTANRAVVTSYHLKKYEEMLPSTIFLRPHQSYLVNSNFIYKIQKNEILELKDGTEIPIAVRRKETIHDYLTQWK